jgi:ribulose-bisphosphate carboxylase small chain
MMTNPARRISQGQFSYLPDLTDIEITLQIEYGLNKGYAWSVEYTDDPHPRNTYWEMFGMPMFDLKDAAGVLAELQNCRKTFPQHYIRLMAFDSTRNVESIVMSFIVNRPQEEPGFGLVRQEAQSRTIRYTVRSYATDRAENERSPPSEAAAAGSPARRAG